MENKQEILNIISNMEDRYKDLRFELNLMDEDIRQLKNLLEDKKTEF